MHHVALPCSLPGSLKMLFDCPAPPLAVPQEVMRHVVRVESGGNPYAIGVVRGRLVRQPRKLDEAVATAQMLEQKGFNFSLGLAQVNRYNLARYKLQSYAQAFDPCANLLAGSHILKECFDRAQDWGKAFSCYYSGNFTTGFKHGYVQKIAASMRAAPPASGASTLAIPVIPQAPARAQRSRAAPLNPRLAPAQSSRTGRSAAAIAPHGATLTSPPVASQAAASTVLSPESVAPASQRDSGFVF